MHNLSQTISEYIEQQFPAVYREDGPNLVAFVKAYYEFLENTSTSPTTLSRSMFQNRDIDETLESFVVHFKEKYLNQFPYAKSVDNRFAIKHIMDFYRSKGSPLSVELLIRMLFNEEATVYFPTVDILKPSDSKWNIPRYIEITRSARSKSFLGKQITGNRSLAKAFVESLVTKRVAGKYIDIMFLSNLQGSFVTNEYVSENGNIIGAPLIIGSLTNLTVVNGGSNNAIGDFFDVTHESGRQAKAKVTSIESATGRVNFDLVFGGNGYTINDLTDGNTLNDYTSVYVATNMIRLDNSNTSNQFIPYEAVVQEKEIVSLLSAADINTQWLTLDQANNYVLGVSDVSVQNHTGDNSTVDFARPAASVANSVVVTVDDVVVTNYTSNSTSITFTTAPALSANINIFEYNLQGNAALISVTNASSISQASNGTISFTNETANEASSTSSVVNLGIVSGSFANQTSIDFANNASLIVNEVLEEGSTIVIGVDDADNWTGEIGSKVEMRFFDDPTGSGNTALNQLVEYAYGYLTAANTTGDTITLYPAWGNFSVSNTVAIYANTSSNTTPTVDSTISSVEITIPGAVGIVSAETDANTWIVKTVYGTFTPGEQARGVLSQSEETISATTLTGATDVWLNGDPTANGVISLIANNTARGFVVGQNTSWVGIYSQARDFEYVEGLDLTIKTVREERVDYSVLEPNINEVVLELSRGQNATFQPGSPLENPETVSLNTDIFSNLNYRGQNILQTVVGTAANSGVGFVNSMSATVAGTGYSVGQDILFEGGGYGDGSPLVQAFAEITAVDGSGGITEITVVNPGHGYWTTPTFTLPDNGGGTDATVTLNMDFGYGFPKNVNGDATTQFQNMFNYDNFTIGRIASLTRINVGSNYNIGPFVSVLNPYIAAYNRQDYSLLVNMSSGQRFTIGDIISQGGDSKGEVVAQNLDESGVGIVTLRRTSFNVVWTVNDTISGSSGATATLLAYETIKASRVMGDNATINAEVVVADGVATGLEITNSGYGYEDNKRATLSRSANPVIITATTSIETQGLGEGYWSTVTSHLSDVAKIHDNKYYQEFSYDIQTGVSIDKYRDIVKSVVHTAGTELFGTVIKNSNINITVAAAPSTSDSVETS